jgi:HNH endonuclease
MLTAEEARRIWRYDPDTGDLVWIGGRPHLAGSVAGSTVSEGRYKAVRYKDRSYLSHRLAWLIVHGSWPVEIDHINGDGLDNRLSNLRHASRQQNSCNRRCGKNNSLGIKGVFPYKGGKFRARIRANGKLIDLGVFNTPEEGQAAYIEAAKAHHGEFARVA